MADARPVALEVRDLLIRFGGLTAVKDFSLTLREREIVGLIGPNGAGKTTVFNLLTGIYTPEAGEIRLRGEPITGLPAWKVTQRGMCRTFQNLRLFQHNTVLENLLIASHQHNVCTPWDAVFRLPRFYKQERQFRDAAYGYLQLVRLEAKAELRATDLSYGEMRRLEIARALATRPSVLLLDEPAAGMNPKEGEELLGIIQRLRDLLGLSILLIEHDMQVVMNLCERILVLDYGEIIAEGAPREIRADTKVIEAYLGEATDDVAH